MFKKNKNVLGNLVNKIKTHIIVPKTPLEPEAILNPKTKINNHQDDKKDKKNLGQEQKDIQKEDTKEKEESDIAENPKKTNKLFLFIIFLISLLLTTTLAIGIIRMNLFSKKNDTDNKPSEEPFQTPIPTPTPEQIDLTKYNLQILNGSGVVGEATYVKEILEREGFIILDTGNAKKYDYLKTEILAKEKVPQKVIDNIIKTLRSEYQIEEKITNLVEGSKYDLVIITGVKNQNE